MICIFLNNLMPLIPYTINKTLSGFINWYWIWKKNVSLKHRMLKCIQRNYDMCVRVSII